MGVVANTPVQIAHAKFLIWMMKKIDINSNKN